MSAHFSTETEVNQHFGRNGQLSTLTHLHNITKTVAILLTKHQTEYIKAALLTAAYNSIYIQVAYNSSKVNKKFNSNYEQDMRFSAAYNSNYYNSIINSSL